MNTFLESIGDRLNISEKGLESFTGAMQQSVMESRAMSERC